MAAHESQHSAPPSRPDSARGAKDLKPGVTADIRRAVQEAVRSAPIHDIHTHLYAPQLGHLLLWGIDELLTYHYLVAEFFRVAARGIGYDEFWSLPKPRQAELIWQSLFVERSPISEAARGVVTCLQQLGLDPDERDVTKHRRWFAAVKLEDQIERVLAISGVQTVVMTNDPFDDAERPRWLGSLQLDERFRASLRLDRLVNLNAPTARTLAELGYQVQPELTPHTVGELRRFLTDWIARTKPLYLAVALPPSFRYPADALDACILDQVILPTAREHDLAVALMIGAKRGLNPRLRLAGDAVGLADVAAVGALCDAHPANRFLCTMLARENQHELAVIARKFANLHVFGCWWFLNTPSLAEEITRLRLELLGLSFTAQHSDARVLEQLIYKWSDARAQAGWRATDEQIRRDVAELTGAGGLRFCEAGGRPARDAR
jgi:hypothetical protein